MKNVSHFFFRLKRYENLAYRIEQEENDWLESYDDSASTVSHASTHNEVQYLQQSTPLSLPQKRSRGRPTKTGESKSKRKQVKKRME